MFRVTTVAALLVSLAVATGVTGCSGASSTPGASAGTGTPAVTGTSTASATTTADVAPSAGTTPSGAATPYAALSNTQVWSQVEKNAHSATSVRVVGVFTYQKRPLLVDLQTKKSAKEPQAVGSVTINGHKLSIRRIGRTIYLKGDRGYWLTYGSKAAANTLAGRWIKATQSNKQLALLFQFTQMDYFTHIVDLPAAGQKSLIRRPGISVAGQPTLGFGDTAPGQETAESGVVYISTTSPTLPLLMKFGIKQSITFQNWNKPVQVPIPPHALSI